MIDREDWTTPLDIPEDTIGKFAVVHDHKPAGWIGETASLRSSLIGGQERMRIQFPVHTRWHQLHEVSDAGGLWMTDYPIEQVQHDVLLAPMKGRVLVGGLGLGYAAQTLAANPEVESVDVVEISEHVIRLVWPHLKHQKKIRVWNADLFEFLREREKGIDRRWGWDWAFYDIWTSDGEHTLFETVIPLRGLSRRLVPIPNVRCWHEDVMRGQLRLGLHSRLHFLPAQELLDLSKPKPDDNPLSVYWNWSVRFFQAIVEGKVPNDKYEEAIDWYADNYGGVMWRSGWNSMLRCWSNG